MSWLFIAIWAPLLWAFSNHIDKYLITKYGMNIGISGIITFSSLCSIFIVILSFLINQNIFSLPFVSILKLFTSGILYSFAVLFYIKALSKDEASIVTPIFQLVPVIAFILGYIFLGEFLNTNQIIGGLIVIVGAVLISIDLSSFKFNKKVFLTMLFSSFLFATYQLFFKNGAGDEFWVAIFWQSIGSFTVGLLFLTLKNYRKNFLLIIKNNSYELIQLSLLVEIVTMGGNLLIEKAVLLAPAIALVLLVESFQSVFVFVLGVIFTITISSFSKESLDKKTIIKKVVSILIILIGSYIIYF